MGLFDKIRNKDALPIPKSEKSIPKKEETVEIKSKPITSFSKKYQNIDIESMIPNIIDKYSLKIDGVDFNIIIGKKDGVMHYEIPEVAQITNTLSNISEEHISKMKSGISEGEFQKISEIQGYISTYSEKNGLNLKNTEIQNLAKYFYLIIGKLGFLEIPLHDDQLEEIMINGLNTPSFVFHRKYQMCKTNIVYNNEEELSRIIENIAMLAGRSINSRTPMLDAFLPDGSRVNATTQDVTLLGNTLTIRKFSSDPLTVIDLIKFGTFNPELAAFLWQAVEGYFGAKPANTLIVGGTGSGKTTTLNVVSMFSMYTDRIITIEDTPELQIPHDHVIKMITRLPRPGIPEYEITMNDLIKNALRMRPDRIFVGEVRGAEAQSLLIAMNTGHDGCSGTLHANSADEAIIRLINPPMNVPKVMISSLDFIINQQRIKRNRKTIRRILGIIEIGGSGEDISKTNLFKYDGNTDSIRKEGICMWEEHVCNIAGITRDELIEDRINRMEVIKYAVKNNIRDIKGVGDLIKRYQENPENVLRNIL